MLLIFQDYVALLSFVLSNVIDITSAALLEPLVCLVGSTKLHHTATSGILSYKLVKVCLRFFLFNRAWPCVVDDVDSEVAALGGVLSLLLVLSHRLLRQLRNTCV